MVQGATDAAPALNQSGRVLPHRHGCQLLRGGQPRLALLGPQGAVDPSGAALFLPAAAAAAAAAATAAESVSGGATPLPPLPPLPTPPPPLVHSQQLCDQPLLPWGGSLLPYIHPPCSPRRPALPRSARLAPLTVSPAAHSHRRHQLQLPMHDLPHTVATRTQRCPASAATPS
jgi:hypothetical protein